MKKINEAYSEENETVKQYLERSIHSIRPLFESWGKIVPLFRASRLLTRSERERLIAEINNFAGVAKIANISITMKMHHLIHHAQISHWTHIM